MLFDDSYKTIEEPVEGFFKDKGSKFLSYAYPVKTETEAKEYLLQIRELHPKAVHHCYAYRFGLDRMTYRMSDDGEPSGTAGRPILNTFYSRDITNILVIVVRYFGGTLLGVPGLIHAYKTATELALDEAEIVIKHLVQNYELKFAYMQMNDIMRIVKEMELPVIEQQFDMQCRMVVEVRTTLIERFMARVDKIEGLETNTI